jgi:signal transduction protein with GAF and PtsI domain
MQTERVTFLTSRDHKAALDSYARDTGMSVGHVVREATSTFISQPAVGSDDDKEAELTALTAELEQAVPQMRDDFSAVVQSMREMNAMMEAYFAEKANNKLRDAA